MATININLTPASVAEINTGTNNNKIVTALGLETSKYSAWIHAGTTVRLTTSTDKVGMGLAVPTHKLHIVSSVTDTMMVTGSVDTGKNAGIEIDADVFGQGILKGSSIFYNENSGAEIYYAFAGSESGVGSAQVGYLNTSTGATSLFVATAADAGMAVNLDGGNEVLAVVFDPAGFKVQGKDSGSTNYIIRGYDGNAVDFGGTLHFGVRNDGLTIAFGSLQVGGNAVQSGQIQMKELSTNGASHIVFAAPASIASNKTQTLQDLTGTIALMDAANAGRFQTAKGAVVASAGDLTLGNDGNLFEITGSNTINAINTTGWQSGSMIVLGVSGTSLIKHNTAGGAGTEPFFLEGQVDCNNNDNTALLLVRSNGFWNEVGRRTYLSNAINDIAGDSVTINSRAGRFRKDTSGTTFTLTNNLITANSIILLQVITTGLTAGMFPKPQAGAGSATIAFESAAGLAEAPSSACDVNFWIIN